MTVSASWSLQGNTATPPFRPAPRYWQGQMCGVHVDGLPLLYPTDDPSLVLSWFVDQYIAANRQRIYAAWKPRYQHTIVSWPDSRANGATPKQFLGTCYELLVNGFYPCPFLTSKDFDSGKSVAQILAELSEVIPLLVGVVPLACIGWELSLWLSPSQLQALIDAIAPQFVAGNARVYIHLQEGYLSWPEEGHDNASFWRKQVGKLTGLLAQKVLKQPLDEFAGWIHDCLARMSGQFNMPADSGFGHPFDFVACELSAMQQFNGHMSEADGDRLGTFAINRPAVTGPGGTVVVMGSGNGREGHS